MISLSDTQREQKVKKIQLRPVTIQNLKPDTTEGIEQNSLSELNKLNDQVLKAKKKLQRLNDEMQSKRLATEQEINAAKEQWLIEKQQLINETKQVAFSEGYEEGRIEGQKSLTAKLEEADQIVESARDEYLNIIGQNEATILELATKIASKIISYEIKENAGFVELVKTAIREVQEQPSIKIYTSAADFQMVNEQYDQLLTLVGSDTVLSIHPLATLGSGGCIIKTPYSQLDVSIDQQLSKIKTRLFEVMEEIKREH